MTQFRILYFPIKPDQGELCSLFILGNTFAEVINSFLAQTNLTEEHIFTIRKTEH